MSVVDDFFQSNTNKLIHFVLHRRRTLSRQDAEDIVNNAYVLSKSFEHKLKDPTKVNSWVHTTILNAASNFVRGFYTTRRFLFYDKVRHGVVYNMDHIIDTARVTSSINHQVSLLPTKQRKALLAKCENPYDQEAMKEAAGANSINTAKHNYLLARRKLVDFAKNIEYTLDEYSVEDTYGTIIKTEEEDY